MMNEVFIVDGMMCANCKNTVEQTIKNTKGVNKVSVNLATKKANVFFDETVINLDIIKKNIEKEGYKVLFLNEIEKYNLIKSKRLKINLYKLIITIIISLFTFYLAMGEMIGINNFIKNPFISCLIQLILSFITILINFNIIKKGTINLIKNHPSMESLISIGVLVSFIYSLILLILDNYSKVYFDSVTMILMFVSVGKYLEEIAIDKTNRSIQSLIDKTPKFATRIINNKEEIINIKEIQVGDILVIKPLENFSVDGVVVEGESSCDNSMLNGEVIPVDIKKNSKVFAGCTNLTNLIYYKAEKIGKDRVIENIIDKVDKAQQSKADIERIADIISSYFTKIILLISFVSALVWLFITNYNISKSLEIFATILVVACPCALGLATPTAIITASGVASKNHILFKEANTIETFSKIKTICFDKTGTLTNLDLSVSKIDSYIDSNLLNRIIYSLEYNSLHPIAKAINLYMKDNNVERLKVSNFENNISKGIGGIINDKNYSITKSSINNCVEIFEDNKLIGKLYYEETVNYDSYRLINYFKSNNIKTILISGDKKENCEKIKDFLDIDEVYAEIAYDQKAKIIEENKKNGKVAMVGDGINDALALTNADVSISLTNATDVAKSTSSILITNSSLLEIINCHRLSINTYRRIKENLYWALGYNLITISLAIFNIINPIIGALLMSISSIFVVTNSLRINLFKGEK